MTRLLLIVLATAAVALLLITQIDSSRITLWAAQVQRDIQNTMAGSVRAVRSGEAGALLALCGLTFGYGVVHAIGPGHGKVLIGGAALASRARMRRLAVLTLLSSLGQSLTAIALVLVGAGLVALSTDRLVDLTETSLAPLSYAAIGLIGLWLAARGLRTLWQHREAQPHHHGSDGTCSCGHSHGPDLSQIDDAMSLREMAVLVISIALRPCTGAIFLLVICWHLGILPAGILATLAMGLGTAAFNLSVAAAGLGAGRLLAGVGAAGRLQLVAPVMQLLAGALIALAAWTMLLPLL